MGGGVVRTAAKAVGPPVAHAAAAFTAGRRTPSSLPTAGFGSVLSLSGEGSPPAAAVKSGAGATTWPTAWETDEYDFGDWKPAAVLETEKEVENGERFVFGPVPSLQEAKAATDDLREAYAHAYYEEPHPEGINEEVDNTKSSSILTAVPKGVATAFQLLQTSPEAQDVVASLASDENVWGAVMKNQKVLEFYTKNQLALLEAGFVGHVPEAGAADDAENVSYSGDSAEDDFWGNIRINVRGVFDSISHFFQEIFEHSTDCASRAAENAEKGGFEGLAAGGGLIGLVIAVIMIVLVKRV